ncbi:type II CRISPR RNA-guided endonuclease Cas9 [Sneathiella sp.]|uniref:type II CRISPR RNA-guided endonuclease Cas9 n=1 Tax=Sneathiella sp. TaxID=1964365 RepID=UPI0035674F96
MTINKPWRLGIDLGTNSLGWAALEINGDYTSAIGIIDSGVRIFSDGRNPKDKQSNAAKRREPRSSRKNRDRTIRRSARLMRELSEFGLMPPDKEERKKLEGGKDIPLEETDPWIIRYRALIEEISPYQLGRAIFHLHQRRGFKSNRKTDRADTESGKVHDATERTLEKLKETGSRTLGELFGKPRYETIQHNKEATKGQRKPQPLARVRKSGAGAQWQYDYYPTRALILDEFGKIWEAQKKYHADLLHCDAYERLKDTIEWQHPLKSPPVGKCGLIPEEPRAAKASPSSQRARIFQEVNSLRLARSGQAQRKLSKEQRDIIADRLLTPTSKTAKVTFGQIKKLLGLSSYDSFSIETEKRKDLQGDETAAKLMQEDRWGTSWLDLDLPSQDEIVDKLVNDEDEEQLVTWLCNTHKLDKKRAHRVADCPLPDGYGNLSQLALTKILPPLEADVTVYSEAVEQSGLGSHSQFGTGEVFDNALPYYGYILERSVAFGTGDPNDPDEKRYGKVANPTVHVALNQIRAVINDLMARFGPPEKIVVELARDLPLSAKGKNDLEKQQKANQDANDKRRKKLAELSQHDTYENRLRLRLYEDLEALGKRCPFSGEQISYNDLFSGKIEIEHILPFSRTLDDSYANKTLATRQANRDKGNRPPFEAFGHSPEGYDWQEISKRAAELPRNKQWRFSPDAMDRFTEHEGGFLARQLTDTQYISRLAKAYLEAIYGGQGYKGAKSHVHVIPGRLTADLRHVWGLNSVLRGHNEPESEAQKKNRDDHRHHALDAIVVACTDVSMLQQAAITAGQNEGISNDKLMAGLQEPWRGFRTDVEQSVRNIMVSHKPDHGIQAAMHNDTAYGISKGEIGEPDKRGARMVVTRKLLDGDSFKSVSDLAKIRDDIIRSHMEEETFGLSGADFKRALLDTAGAMIPPVYKVRVEEKLSVIPIKNASGKEYKAYKGDGNYCYDIWQTEKGKWTGEVISTYQAYQLARKDNDWWQRLEGREGQKLQMRLRKKDYLQVEHNGTVKIVQICKFTEGAIALAEHIEANVDARTRDPNDGLKFIFKSPASLQFSRAKYVTVSPSGVPRIHQISG